MKMYWCPCCLRQDGLHDDTCATPTLRYAEGETNPRVRTIRLEKPRADVCDKCGYAQSFHNNGGHAFVPKGLT